MKQYDIDHVNNTNVISAEKTLSTIPTPRSVGKQMKYGIFFFFLDLDGMWPEQISLKNARQILQNTI